MAEAVIDNTLSRLVHRLPDQILYRIARRNFTKVSIRMTSPYMGYQPFGWDWPTARMLYPLQVRHADRCKAELQRRAELAGANWPDYRRELQARMLPAQR